MDSKPNDQPALRAALYSRTSSDDGDLTKKRQGKRRTDDPSKDSIDVQIEKCKELCKRQNFQVTEPLIFREPDRSGRMYPKDHRMSDFAVEEYFNKHIRRESRRYREQLGLLFDNISAVDVVVVYDITRLVRLCFHSFLADFIWQFFTQHHIRLFTCERNGEILFNDFHTAVMLDLEMQMQDKVKRDETKKSIEGLIEKRDKGFLVSRPNCYGFETAGHQKVKPVQEELDVVRDIFTRFLNGMPVLEITRYLNDDRKAPRWINNKDKNAAMRWSNEYVRRILQRPCYAGLTRNTEGKLIASQSYPSGSNSIITPDEFYHAQQIFRRNEANSVVSQQAKARRAALASAGKSLKGGSVVGVPKNYKGNIIIHPLSGFLKCGFCGKNLLIATNPYYKHDKIKTYSYICKSFLYSKQFKPCSHIRILEEYPQSALEFIDSPTGNGLLDALFPVLFMGYIVQYTRDNKADQKSTIKRDVLRQKLEEGLAYEKKVTSAWEQGKLDDEQYSNVMADRRQERDTLKLELANIEKQIADTEASRIEIPDHLFREKNKIDRSTIRSLAEALLSEIIVFPDKIKVIFKDKHWFELERVRIRNARMLPFWKASINKASISVDTRIGIAYYYRSTQRNMLSPVHVVYKSENLEIITLGNNESIDKSRTDIRTEAGPFNDLISKILGPVPTYNRQLNIKPEAFLTAILGDKAALNAVRGVEYIDESEPDD